MALGVRPLAPTLRRAMARASLLAGWYKVRDNRGCGGTDGVTLADFESALDAQIVGLQREVLGGSYRPRPLLRAWMLKPNGARRGLAIPAVRDRVAQSAVAQLLEPVFEAEFEDCSFAYRQGRSVKRALERVARLRDEGYVWVVDADITAFFDNIDHDLLLREVARLVKDEGLLRLLRLWLEAEVQEEDGRLTRMTQGVPQGSPVSPLLANLFLDHLDDAMLDADLRLVRYADDFLVLCRSEARARDALALTEGVLERLRLRLNPAKTRVVDFDGGFRFLGARFVRSLVVKSLYPDESPVPTDAAARGVFSPASPAPGPQPGAPPTVPADGSLPQVGELLLAPQLGIRRPAAAPQGWVLRERDGIRVWDDADPTEPLPPSPLAAALAAAGLRASPAVPATTTADMPPAAEPLAPSALPPTPPDVSDGEADVAACVDEPAAAEGVDIWPTGADLPPEEIAPPPQAPRRDHLLRTLYIVEPGCELGRHGARLEVRKDDAVLQEVPAAQLDLVMVLGNCQITTQAMQLCLKEGIAIALLSGHGQFYGRIEAIDGEPVDLQRAQFARAEEPGFVLARARSTVQAKIANQRLVLRRFGRHRPQVRLAEVDAAMRVAAAQAARAPDLDTLMGLEGSAAKAHFEGLRRLLPAHWSFTARQRQPPPDPVNALLSYGYTLLFSNVLALLRARGLNPYVGFLHGRRWGHPALASDLMEEFRAPVVDSLVLKLLLAEKLVPDDFVQHEDSCQIRPEGRRRFIHAFEERLQETQTHPTTGETLDYRRCIDTQVRALARCLRGTADAYAPFQPR